MENKDTEKVDAVVLPGAGLPAEVMRLFEKGMKPSQSRARVFEDDKQRNLGALRKGLQKPGFISYEVLRRASMSVPVARICVTTLKEKITKTEWVIKSKDPMVDIEDGRIEKVTELLNNPNPQDTWREFIDKVLEDLLTLDTSCIEKTRFPDGELAQLFYVDSATIRPVFDEYGNQDIPIQLKTENGEEVLPVSYLQIFQNSMYGGPESGEIVAAWAKKDFICFHMHPQGSLERFGYGLSPLESVLSVVNNLLNSDNYNGSYFDEGSFPPIIMQLAGGINQRDLEAYREYMYAELEGNFHRPAIMAGGGELKIHNLKDSSNRDMQFMEYTNWLAKLMTAAYGLSPQDIGITDAVGGKNVAETQADLSNQKGYSSCLKLIEEIINNQIILKDFGYKDMIFKFVLDDSTDPDVQSKIHDLKLKNGTRTINEVREEEGLIPYGEWADQPMLLTTEGYKPMVVEDHEEEETTDKVGEETVYQEDGAGTISKSIYTGSGFKTFMDDRGFGQPFIVQNIIGGVGWVIKPPVAVNLYSQELEVEITNMLASKGLNVNPVKKMLYNDICNLFGNTDIIVEFQNYINMTPQYDSEKWRVKHGGSRKYPFYMVCDFINGFPLSSKEILDDMKRDPNSYLQAISDLAKLWKAEKEFVLGDRRADQYIITPQKRAYGFDYQFKGDKKRWEDSSTSIAKLLIGIPILYNAFNREISIIEKPKATSIGKKIKDIVKGALFKPEDGAESVELDIETNPVLFGKLFLEQDKDSVKRLFMNKSPEMLVEAGYREIQYTYDWNSAMKLLISFVDFEPNSSGGILLSETPVGIKYCIYFKVETKII